MDYSSIANLPNIGPGSTGDSVRALQTWLVKNGFMTQADMNTGPGIYGPKTTSAVAAWQRQAGFDTQGNPGWFGPLSKTYIQQQTTQKSSAPAAPPAPAASATPPISPQKALISAIADVASSAATTGKPPLSFADALDAAAKDPNIIAKYADASKLDLQSFTQQLNNLKTNYSTQSELYKTQFENERKALAEQQAAAGRAYSGFRGKAQQDLLQQEAGIVTSSKSQLQNALNQMTSQFESKYGTGMTPPAAITAANPLTGGVTASGLKTSGGGTETVTGQIAGGITGTETAAKAADTRSSALQSYQTAQFPNV